MQRLIRFIISVLSMLGIVWLIEQTGAQSSDYTIGIVFVAALIISYITKPQVKT